MIPIFEPEIDQKDIDAVVDALHAGYLSGRSHIVQDFGAEFSKVLYDSKKTSYAVSNGTVAIQLALEVGGIEYGDPVVVPAITYAATVNAVLDAGGVPVFVDLSPNSWCPDPHAYSSAINRVGAQFAVVVHLYGEVVKVHNIWAKCLIVEDCAEAMGRYYPSEEWEVQETCGIHPKTIATHSLFANKDMTSGEGGFASFPLEHDSDTVIRLMNNGSLRSSDYVPWVRGHNMRMSALQAAFGMSQLGRLFKTLMGSRGMMDYYRGAMAELPYQVIEAEHPWLFGVGLDDRKTRDELANFLYANGVETRLPFCVLPNTRAYQRYSFGNEYPNAQKRFDEWLFLPSNPRLKVHDQLKVINLLREFVGAYV